MLTISGMLLHEARMSDHICQTKRDAENTCIPFAESTGIYERGNHMKGKALRVFAVAAACTLLMQGMPVCAITDAYPNGYVKIETESAKGWLLPDTK